MPKRIKPIHRVVRPPEASPEPASEEATKRFRVPDDLDTALLRATDATGLTARPRRAPNWAMRLLCGPLFIAILSLLLQGCSLGTETTTEVKPNPPVDQQSSPAAQGTASESTSGGVQPMTPAPIPNAPVAGTESLQGSGGGTGQAAKDMARRAAGAASAPPPAESGE